MANVPLYNAFDSSEEKLWTTFNNFHQTNNKNKSRSTDFQIANKLNIVLYY